MENQDNEDGQGIGRFEYGLALVITSSTFLLIWLIVGGLITFLAAAFVPESQNSLALSAICAWVLLPITALFALTLFNRRTATYILLAHIMVWLVFVAPLWFSWFH